MKLRLQLIIVTLTSLFFLKAEAQEEDSFRDYFINITNDTIRCDIRAVFTFNNYKLKYKTKNDKQYQIGSLDSVKLFFIGKDSIKYTVRLLPKVGKLSFLSILEQGRINLYELSKQNYNSIYGSTFWYGEKGQDSLKQIKIVSAVIANSLAVGSHKEREQNFMNLISDNPDLLNRFKEARKSAEYSFELIQYYIKTYNEEYLESQKNTK